MTKRSLLLKLWVDGTLENPVKSGAEGESGNANLSGKRTVIFG